MREKDEETGMPKTAALHAAGFSAISEKPGGAKKAPTRAKVKGNAENVNVLRRIIEAS